MIAKEEAIAEAKRNYGYFVLLSNEVKDAVKALEIYLFKNYTMQEILDEFDVIECFEVPGHQLQVGEITKAPDGILYQA